jgi:hypothetical protein
MKNLFFTKNPEKQLFCCFSIKNLVTIDDYRATAFVQKKEHAATRQSKEPIAAD